MATALEHFLTQRLADAQGDAAAQEIHALRTLSAADPSTTARELVRAAEAAARAGDEAAAEGHLWRLWRLLCDAARSAPDAQDKLAALVDAISRLPDVEREGGGAAVVWDMKMWADMPIWHAHWTEWEFNVPPFAAADVEKDAYRAYLNICAFAVRLSARKESGAYSLLGFGAREIMMALEEEPWKTADDEEEDSDSDDEWMARQRELSSIRSLDATIPVVAEWITGAGHILFATRVEVPRRIGPENLWQGENISCPERWELWKTRLAWVATVDELRPQTRDLAKDCLQAMSQAEAETVAV